MLITCQMHGQDNATTTQQNNGSYTLEEHLTRNSCSPSHLFAWLSLSIAREVPPRFSGHSTALFEESCPRPWVLLASPQLQARHQNAKVEARLLATKICQ